MKRLPLLSFALVTSLAAAAPGTVSIIAEQPYLLLPVRNGGEARKLSITVDGKIEREMVIELADGKEADWWALVDISRWRGKRLRIEMDGPPTAPRALEQIRQSAQPPAPHASDTRPVFHFTPPRGWTNDPNGLVFHDGEYHLFYQHNPYGTRWQNMSWGHAVSRDLVRWEGLPIALHQHGGEMMFSGSAVVDQDNTSGLAERKTKPPLVAIYTAHRIADGRQTQHIAYSNDNGRTWTKYGGNPVLDIESNGFRDPKVFWHAPSSRWVMVVAHADDKIVGFYGSPDLKTWNHLSDFGPAGARDKPNWECPDLFPLPIEDSSRGETRWLLHVSMGGGAVAGGSGAEYFIGDFDGTTFRSETPDDHVSWTDFGRDFYAAQSWSGVPNQDGRRIWIGWMTNLQYAGDIPTGPGWRGMMSIPRSLSLRRVGEHHRLIQRPVKELERLREHEGRLEPRVLDDEAVCVEPDAGDAIEIIADFRVDTAKVAGLRLRGAGGQQIVCGYDAVANAYFVDRTRSGNVDFHPGFAGRHHAAVEPAADRSVRMHLFVDRCSVELFGNDGEATITDLIFPQPAGPRTLEAFAEGGAAEFRALHTFRLARPQRGE